MQPFVAGKGDEINAGAFYRFVYCHGSKR